MTLSLSLAFLSELICAVCLAAPVQQAVAQNEREHVRKQLQQIADRLAGKRSGEDWSHPPDVLPTRVMEYLKKLESGDELRLEAIALARRYASPSDLIRQKADFDSRYHRLAHQRLRFAWRVLMETGVLREGLTHEEAVAILGPSILVSKTTAGGYSVDWYYSSPMHVNPSLYCTFKDGRIEKILVLNK